MTLITKVFFKQKNTFAVFALPDINVDERVWEKLRQYSVYITVYANTEKNRFL